MKTSLLVIYLAISSPILFAQTETSLSLGRTEYQQENYGEALKLLAKAAIEEPANAEVPFLIAHVYSDISDYKQSASYFEKAIGMDSTHPKWIYECGLIYFALPDYKKSLQFIELAGARGYKRTLDYTENLANALVNTKQYPQAIELYKEVIIRKPADKEMLFQLAQAYFYASKYQDALDTWTQLLTLDTTNAEALYMTGLCYQKQGDKTKGQQICDKAIVWDPSLASKRKTMGGESL